MADWQNFAMAKILNINKGEFRDSRQRRRYQGYCTFHPTIGAG